MNRKMLIVGFAAMLAVTNMAWAQRDGGRGDIGGNARNAGTGILAVPDTRSNSVIVVASSDTMQMVENLIAQMEDLTSETMQYAVFPLKYAEARDLSDAISELFEPQTQSSSRRATTRVRAESDDQTNSVLIAAPIEDMPTIERIILEVDSMIEDVTEVRVFTLRYADAEETATVIEDLFEATSSRNNRDQPTRFGGGFFGFGRGGDRRGGGNQRTDRMVQEETVTAVPDTRTNSIIVRAASEIMVEIGKAIENLDANPSKSKKVFVYQLNNANVEELGATLESMFSGSSGASTLQNRLNQTQNQNNQRYSTRGGAGSGFGGGSTRGGSNRGSGTNFGSTR